MRFLVLQDYKENRRKCTAFPLRDLSGFEFVRLAPPRPLEEPLEVGGEVWLVVDAPPLIRDDREVLSPAGTIVVFDSSWARVGALRSRVRPAPGVRPLCRSLPADLVTAYPRRSKLYTDPVRGLATVEAIFAVTAVWGEPRWEILRHYPWASEFLEINQGVFQRLGIQSSEVRGHSSEVGVQSSELRAQRSEVGVERLSSGLRGA